MSPDSTDTQYVQTVPTKAQRDALFDACETIQDRQRWFAKVGSKGYMVESPANPMFRRFVVEMSKMQAKAQAEQSQEG